MIRDPIIPDDPKMLQSFLREYLPEISRCLQVLGSGREYPQINGQNREQYWDDFVSSFNAGKQVGVGANAPTWTAFKGDIEQWRFSASTMNEIILAPLHILHSLKPNTKVYPHVHWASSGTNAGTVRWGVEYTFAKGHQQGAGSVFPDTQTIYIEQAATGTAYEHMVAEYSTGISSANIEPDSLFIARIFRDAAHVNDTCTDAVFGLMFDIHYQKSFWATKNKAPNFYE